jgi:hypothetical protein
MRCPYCAEEVKDEAVVCKHCHSELFVVRPLLEKINEMSARMAALTQAESHLEAEVASHVHHTPARRRHPGLSGLESVALTYIGLVLAHFLIIVHFDSKLLYLRIVSIAVPFLFGFLYRETERTNLLAELFWGVVVAAAAILSMAAIVSEVDHVPLLPKDAHEWGEFAQYSASIGFGFLTGVITRLMLIAIYAPSGKANFVVEWIARFIVEQFTDGKPKFTLKAIRSMVSSVLGFGSAIISIITGLWEFLK